MVGHTIPVSQMEVRGLRRRGKPAQDGRAMNARERFCTQAVQLWGRALQREVTGHRRETSQRGNILQSIGFLGREEARAALVEKMS